MPAEAAKNTRAEDSLWNTDSGFGAACQAGMGLSEVCFFELHELTETEA
jgi:hypothetical protein